MRAKIMKISEKDEWITGHVAMNALKENFALRESFLVLVFCYYLGFILMTSVVVFMLWTSSWFLAMNFLLSMIYFQFHACEMSTSSHSTIFLNHKSTTRGSLLWYIKLNNFQISKHAQDFDNFTRKFRRSFWQKVLLRCDLGRLF